MISVNAFYRFDYDSEGDITVRRAQTQDRGPPLTKAEIIFLLYFKMTNDPNPICSLTNEGWQKVSNGPTIILLNICNISYEEQTRTDGLSIDHCLEAVDNPKVKNKHTQKTDKVKIY